VIVLTTTGATAPPAFLVARPDSVVKTRPSHVPTAPLQQSESQLGVARILLLGDSVADTLSKPLESEAALHGVVFRAITRPGCGMTSDAPLRADGTQVPWGDACASFTPTYESGAVREVDPNVVLWLSTWETSDVIDDGHAVDFGTPAGDAALLAQLETARSRLEAGGARLVLVTIPAPADTSEVKPLRPDEGTRRHHLNNLFRLFAARHPSDVAVADLAAIVCPRSGNSCPAAVDGVVLRPRDGNHFEGDGPSWVAPRLYTAIMRALSTMPPPELPKPAFTTAS
jgi:hypothetical protein